MDQKENSQKQCSEEEKEKILKEFAEKIMKDQKDLPGDYARHLNENFWDLLL